MLMRLLPSRMMSPGWTAIPPMRMVASSAKPLPRTTATVPPENGPAPGSTAVTGSTPLLILVTGNEGPPAAPESPLPAASCSIGGRYALDPPQATTESTKPAAKTQTAPGQGFGASGPVFVEWKLTA